MNENDIEERLRSVTEGQQPSAPASLHRFLQHLPEAQAAHERGPLGRARHFLDRLSGLGMPRPYARRVQMAFGAMAAVVIGIAGTGLLLSLRQGPVSPAASSSNGTPAPWVTPRRSIDVKPSPVQARPTFQAEASTPLDMLDQFVWTGTTVIDNENMALPLQVVSLSSVDIDYLGVADSMDGLVRSNDGLYWDWIPASSVDPKAAILASIAYDQGDTIVAAGAVQGVAGVMDGRVWYSKDGGRTWKRAIDEETFNGVTVRKVVYGSGKFVALGWNDLTPADARRQVGAWSSADGINWSHIAVPIQGTSALLVPTAGGFLLSGTPLAAGEAIDEVPIWTSADLRTWTRATSKDNTAQMIGPLFSASVDSLSYIAALSTSTDGLSSKMVYSKDSGLTWSTVKPNPDLANGMYVSMATGVATFSVSKGGVYYQAFLIATAKNYGHLYVSIDYGATWLRIYDPAVGGPNGAYLLEIGNGYLAGERKVLAIGEKGSGMGIWLATLQAVSW
jgi:hypothetical protein